jgi:2-polyprenyl-3-methyl-5-hydroxy-6-metoxy-1,4-benzoquinol methylase
MNSSESDAIWEQNYTKKGLKIKERLLNSREINHVGNLRDVVLKACKGKSVLDIGGAEHRFTAAFNPEQFMHGKICKVASKVTGVDIVPSAVKQLNKIGYNFVLMDATSDKYLGEKFDIVHMGDVIEHVNDPVALLRFAKRHLKKNGKILVATPNPYCISNILQLLKENTLVVNLEHTSWITPSMALEIGNRAKAKLEKYVVSEPGTKWKKMASFWMPIEFKASSYLYIFK